MKQTITIEIPEGKTYKQTTDKDGNIVIQYVDKEPVRSKTWKEFCKNHPYSKEYYIDSSSKIIEDTSYGEYGKTRNVMLNKNSLATKEDAEGILALIQLTRLHDEWVGDWDPRHSLNIFEISYDIYFKIFTVNKSIIRNNELLMFPTKEMAQEFLACFRDLIETAKRFI